MMRRRKKSQELDLYRTADLAVAGGTNRRAVAQPEGAGASQANDETVIHQTINNYQTVVVAVDSVECVRPSCTRPRNTATYVHRTLCETCLTEIRALRGTPEQNTDWLLAGDDLEVGVEYVY